MKRILACLAGLAFILAPVFTACSPLAPLSLLPQYYAPLQNAQYVSASAGVILRYGPLLTAALAASIRFDVVGSQSGRHAGHVILSDDHQTLIFTPDVGFAPGERVDVSVPAVDFGSGTRFRGLHYSFDVASHQQPGGIPAGPPPANPPRSAFPTFLTVPQDIPHFTLSAPPGPDPNEGDIFVAPFYWTGSTVGSYLLILNQHGQLVYYRSMANDLAGFDFKVQPDGNLSYFSQKDAAFYVMNSHYQVVDRYAAGNGYQADVHDLQFLPNGNALLMIYDTETVDMSRVVPGGQKNAAVTGLVIQELDRSKNVIFEWRSWDHFSFQDSTAVLTAQQIDLVHGNALAVASDGNLLLSSRNLSEITKINIQTGAVMWRLGGRANMFRFVNGQPFAFQHDVRQLPNGDITVFDNQGTTQNPAASHGIEYRIDDVSKTVTVVWDFVHSPAVFATFMGNTQRLPSGNTFLSWGAPFTHGSYNYFSMTEVTPQNQTLLDFTFDQPYVSYRAFIFPWHGQPATLPTLAYRADATGMTLGYSWNGATDVASYRLFGGASAQSLTVIDQKPSTDFETQSSFSILPKGECYFQVAALDGSGQEMARSKVITTDGVLCPLPH